MGGRPHSTGRCCGMPAALRAVAGAPRCSHRLRLSHKSEASTTRPSVMGRRRSEWREPLREWEGTSIRGGSNQRPVSHGSEAVRLTGHLCDSLAWREQRGRAGTPSGWLLPRTIHASVGHTGIDCCNPCGERACADALGVLLPLVLAGVSRARAQMIAYRRRRPPRQPVRGGCCKCRCDEAIALANRVTPSDNRALRPPRRRHIR
jgi:hypothetical protein